MLRYVKKKLIQNNNSIFSSSCVFFVFEYISLCAKVVIKYMPVQVFQYNWMPQFMESFSIKLVGY